MAKSAAMVKKAVERGVNYFDTAYIYPGNEEALGQIVADNGLRSKISIATKLPLFMVKSRGDFDKFFTASLKRLKIDRVDYYLMHMITTPAQWRGLCDMGIEEWIGAKKKSGQIGQLGFSFHGRREDFPGIVDMRDWDFAMIQYNYLDINNQAGRSGLRYAASKGIPVMVMEPLLGGRLADPKMLPPAARAAVIEDGLPYPIAVRGLRWVWNHPEVTLLLSGMSAMEQLDQNIAAADEIAAPDILEAKELHTIDRIIAAFSELNKIPCTACGYCMPCPLGVNIPGCFSAFNFSHIINSRYRALNRYMHESGALSSKRGMAGACKGCGKCEAHCPQNIPIRKSLGDVSRRLEPLVFKAALSIARAFMAKSGK